ncbi:MAG: NUDIX domain-containing protein [Streptosporangiaceae bacterium]
MGSDAKSILDGYRPLTDSEAADVARIREIAGDPWLRDTPLHLTASAVIVHPSTRRVLLRWHERQQAWLQVGGHGDPGESDPLAIALRESEEESGLTDLTPWPDAALRHASIVKVAPSKAKGEPAHEHADLRYFLATAEPEAIRPETPGAELRWLTLEDAMDFIANDSLAESLRRLSDYLTPDAGRPAR